MTEIVSPPLWRQLQLTAKVVQQIGQGRSGTALLEEVPVDMRPGVQALTFTVLRSLGMAQSLAKLLARRAPPPPARALLWTALALLCTGSGALYDAFTLVNQTIEAAKRTPSIKQQAPFINACLRRFLRESDIFVAQAKLDATALWNHPAWWIAQLQRDWPDQWQAILAANNRQGPLTLRINTKRISRQDYLEKLTEVGMGARFVSESGLELNEAVGVHHLPGYSEGWFSVQDSAAQLAAPLLLADCKDQRCLRVLDACAAPGGKTAHLLELKDVAVTALDVDPQRCERIHHNLARLGLTARIVTADATNVAAWWDGVAFDAILLDAPCSASGIVRRHPDIRWLRRSGDIDQLAAIQATLLRKLWSVLKPGGRMLYSTCSVFKAEGSMQIDAFLAGNREARLLSSPEHLLPSSDTIDHSVGNHDGFYYALLEKTLV